MLAGNQRIAPRDILSAGSGLLCLPLTCRTGLRIALGGVIPPQDYAALKAAGIGAIFGPGTNILAAAAELLMLIQSQRAVA